MKKVLVLSVFLGVALYSGGSTAHGTEISYDLNETAPQTTVIQDEDGVEIVVTIEKEEDFLRGVANGTYRVHTKRAGSWEASYKIVVKSDEITSAKEASATAYSGLFISKSLAVDNAKQATYYLKRKVGAISSTINLRSKIVNNGISVTV